MKASLIGFIIGMLAGLITLASGQQVQLAWDASPSASVTNYVLYYIGAGTNQAKIDTGTNTTVTLSGMPGGIYTNWVTAMAAYRIESLPSSNLVLEVPQPAGRYRVLVPQANATLSGTNWINMGFFRIQILP